MLLFFCCSSFLSCFLLSYQADLEKAAEQVNAVETEQGMLAALTAGVGSNCKCLTLFTPGNPLNPQQEEPEGLTYEVSVISCFWSIDFVFFAAFNPFFGFWRFIWRWIDRAELSVWAADKVVSTNYCACCLSPRPARTPDAPF